MRDPTCRRAMPTHWPLVVLAMIATAISVPVPNADRPALSSSVRTDRSAPGLLEGIRLDSSLERSDIAFLQSSLAFLHRQAPNWYAYVAEAKPLALSVDESKGELGLAATSKCCSPDGYGLITFGDHWSQMSTTSEGNMTEDAQVAFLSTLVHEATHIHDHRTGRIPPKIDFASCIATEKSAFTNEVEFKRALLLARSDSFAVDGVNVAALEQQIEAERRAFEGDALKLYCLDRLLGPAD